MQDVEFQAHLSFCYVCSCYGNTIPVKNKVTGGDKTKLLMSVDEVI